jgi:hypothetical protein
VFGGAVVLNVDPLTGPRNKKFAPVCRLALAARADCVRSRSLPLRKGDGTVLPIEPRVAVVLVGRLFIVLMMTVLEDNKILCCDWKTEMLCHKVSSAANRVLSFQEFFCQKSTQNRCDTHLFK